MKSTALVLIGLVASACSRSPAAPQGTIAPIDVAAPPPDATITSTGLAYRVLVAGTGGRHPGPDAWVVVNFTGWTTDGSIIEGAPIGGQPVSLQLSQAIPGWKEGLRMMSAGDKRRFWIPGALAYGDQAGKPHGMLVYDITLVSFVE